MHILITLLWLVHFACVLKKVSPASLMVTGDEWILIGFSLRCSFWATRIESLGGITFCILPVCDLYQFLFCKLICHPSGGYIFVIS